MSIDSIKERRDGGATGPIMFHARGDIDLLLDIAEAAAAVRELSFGAHEADTSDAFDTLYAALDALEESP